MKTTTNKDQRFLLIATHMFVASICTNPYIVTILADIHRIATRNTAEASPLDQSMLAVMWTISFTTLVVALAAYALHIRSKRLKH